MHKAWVVGVTRQVIYCSRLVMLHISVFVVSQGLGIRAESLFIELFFLLLLWLMGLYNIKIDIIYGHDLTKKIIFIF